MRVDKAPRPNFFSSKSEAAMLFRCDTQFRVFSKWSRSSPSSALTVTGGLKSQETTLPLGVPTWVSSRYKKRGSLFPEAHAQNVIASRRLREIRKLGQGQGQHPFFPPPKIRSGWNGVPFSIQHPVQCIANFMWPRQTSLLLPIKNRKLNKLILLDCHTF